MNFKTLIEQDVKLAIFDEMEKKGENSDCAITMGDPFLLEDFRLAIEGKYRLQILNNSDGITETYRLNNALIDVDSLSSNALTYRLELTESSKGIDLTRDFNISYVEPNTNNIDNPKYYIYCDNSDKKSFRFWFLHNTR